MSSMLQESQCTWAFTHQVRWVSLSSAKLCVQRMCAECTAGSISSSQLRHGPRAWCGKEGSARQVWLRTCWHQHHFPRSLLGSLFDTSLDPATGQHGQIGAKNSELLSCVHLQIILITAESTTCASESRIRWNSRGKKNSNKKVYQNIITERQMKFVSV